MIVAEVLVDVAEAGFAVRAMRLIDFPGCDTLARRLGVTKPRNTRWVVRLDDALSRLMAWNARYWRARFVDKLAPRTAYWIAERI